jgi:phage terminase large subunit-like protein
MPWQTPEYYVSQKQQLRLNTYLRLHENRWVSSESSMFDMEKWDSCIDEDHSPPLPDKSIHLWVGVDASTKKDRSAVVSVYRDGSKVRLGPKRFWQPTAADPMDLEETMESYLLELNKGYTLISVKYDPFQFHRSAMTLAKKGLPMVEYPQTTTNLTEIGQNIYDLVQYRNIILYPCKDLRFEATCAIGKETTRGVRIVKEKLSHKVDQIVSLAMAALDAAKERDGLMPEFNRQRHTYKCERKVTLP